MPAAARGRAAGKSAKLWRDALFRELNQKVDKSAPDSPRRLELVAKATVDAAIAGDMSAAREIGDRLDGKANQPLSGDDGSPFVIQIVRYGDNPAS